MSVNFAPPIYSTENQEQSETQEKYKTVENNDKSLNSISTPDSSITFKLIKPHDTSMDISDWRNYTLPPISQPDISEIEAEVAKEFEMSKLYAQLQTV